MIWQKRFGVELIAVFVMIAVVSVLAVYQYRWTGEISRTEQTRLRTSLATSIRNFDQEFSYDFQQLCESFELDPEVAPSAIENDVERHQASWSTTSAHADVVSGLYVSKNAGGNARVLESFDQTDGRFHDVNWPADLRSLHQFLTDRSVFPSSPTDDRAALYYPWTFYVDSTALVRPIFQFAPSGQDSSSSLHTAGVLIVTLNREYLARTYFPELISRHFGASGQRSFIVSIRTAQPPYRTIYVSDENAPTTTSSSDATINLFDLVGEQARRRGHPLLQASNPDEQWQLIAQHPSGSLERAVATWRRRNLAINLGLLAILAGSMALIFSVARRSKALAKMQMEFVAGVSHELCTPLAVINTAAENLADGVVENGQQIQEYGGLIRAQGHRLGRLVDEILLFTAGRFGLSGYDPGPVDVASILGQGLSTAGANLHDAGFTIKKEIEPKLPPIVADPSAAITCIENVVSNAIKYSPSNKWISIRACKASNGSKQEVLIIVEDKGIGISTTDLAHIFEPFYRAQSARNQQIRGVGLGLHLVKRMMEDVGGHVSITSEIGRGTKVVLHFPAAKLPVRRQGNGA